MSFDILYDINCKDNQGTCFRYLFFVHKSSLQCQKRIAKRKKQRSHTTWKPKIQYPPSALDRDGKCAKIRSQNWNWLGLKHVGRL